MVEKCFSAESLEILNWNFKHFERKLLREDVAYRVVGDLMGGVKY